MRWISPGLAALLLATQALAQGGTGMPGGGGGGGGPGGPPPGGGGPGGPGTGQPRPMKPIKRARFDRVVTAMFQAADTDRDGLVTLGELRMIVAARRDAMIRARFDKVDADRNGSISLAEFTGWQQGMGSLALSEDQPVTDRGGPIPATIEPDLGDDAGDRALAMVIEPLGALTIVHANTNYDAGMSLEELLAYQGKRFDAADTDRDGELSPEEVRVLMRRGEGPGRGGPGGPGPGPAGPGGDGPPPCPPGRDC